MRKKDLDSQREAKVVEGVVVAEDSDATTAIDGACVVQDLALMSVQMTKNNEMKGLMEEVNEALLREDRGDSDANQDVVPQHEALTTKDAAVIVMNAETTESVATTVNVAMTDEMTDQIDVMTAAAMNDARKGVLMTGVTTGVTTVEVVMIEMIGVTIAEVAMIGASVETIDVMMTVHTVMTKISLHVVVDPVASATREEARAQIMLKGMLEAMQVAILAVMETAVMEIKFQCRRKHAIF